MSQLQTQNQSPNVHDIRSHIRDDGSVHCDHGRLSLLTSNTTKNFHRQFFACPLARDDQNRCKFFMWLDEIRKDEEWDENLFRIAYPQYRPPEGNLAAPETPRKRRTPPSSLPGPSPPKRICHAQPEEDRYLSDEDYFASPLTSSSTATSSTPSRGLRNTRAHEWPLTPSSPCTREPHTVVANASPSRESVRRHETRVTAQLPHLQNFDGVTDLSPLSLTPNSQASQAARSLPARAVASADEVEDVFGVTVDYVRKLERRSIANQRASDAKMARIQQLEDELERSQQQISKLKRENERLIRANERLQDDRLSRLHSA